jgi:phosphopantetheine adenylyltransferase
MAFTKNNVFKEYEAQLIASEKQRLSQVQENLNKNKESINHIRNVSDVYTSKMISIIGTLLGKKQ